MLWTKVALLDGVEVVEPVRLSILSDETLEQLHA